MSLGQYFYHYTSTAGANAIRNEKVLRSKNGIDLSTLKPEDHTRDDILHSIYGSTIPSEFKNRADNVVYVSDSIIDSSKLIVVSPNLYQYAGEITVSASDVTDKPKYVNNVRSSTSSSSGSGWSRSSGSQSNPQTLYYYTNYSTANAILSSGYIPFNGNIFLTSMKPENYYRNEILNTIYGKSYDRSQYATFADWCIRVDVTKLDASKLNRNHSNVYEYADYIQVDPSDVMDKPKCNKAQGSDADEYFYHYTNTAGAQAIKAAGFLKKSGPSGAFGVVVYMTKLKPTDFFRDDILKNNYGSINSAFKGRADFVVRVKSSSLVKTKLKSVNSNVTRDDSRVIYVYEDVVHVSSSDVYDKPKCYRAK